MPNKIVLSRLKAIRSVLLSAHDGGSGQASSMIGAERESFINLVLHNVVPPPFRIGTGEITDKHGALSGQVDIVVEYANTLSFPLLQGNSARLYLAESVCCVIEVKSSLDGQWDDVVKKAKLLATLERSVGAIQSVGPLPSTIPMFVVGFEGWSEVATCKKKLREADSQALSGVLVLDTAIYAGAAPYEELSVKGSACILGLLLSIEHLTSSLMATKPNFAGHGY